jgi:hypothetical protein
MKISSRIFVMLLLVLGVAFAVMMTRAYATGRTKCGNLELKIALDANGCETLDPLPVTDQQMEDALKTFGVGKECYKIRFWSKPDQNGQDHLEKEIGDLDLTECMANDKARIRMTQPHGGGATQRVMFNSPVTKEAFERQNKATKK